MPLQCASGLDRCTVWAAALQEEYQKPRLRRNAVMMAGLHSLQRGFSAGWLPGAAQARGLGMGMLNAAPGARDRLMQVAMGDM